MYRFLCQFLKKKIPIKQKFIWTVSSTRSRHMKESETGRFPKDEFYALCPYLCHEFTELWWVSPHVFAVLSIFRGFFFWDSEGCWAIQKPAQELHSIRTTCLVYLPRNNQEKSHVRKHVTRDIYMQLRGFYLSELVVILALMAEPTLQPRNANSWWKFLKRNLKLFCLKLIV